MILVGGARLCREQSGFWLANQSEVGDVESSWYVLERGYGCSRLVSNSPSACRPTCLGAGCCLAQWGEFPVAGRRQKWARRPAAGFWALGPRPPVQYRGGTAEARICQHSSPPTALSAGLRAGLRNPTWLPCNCRTCNCRMVPASRELHLTNTLANSTWLFL